MSEQVPSGPSEGHDASGPGGQEPGEGSPLARRWRELSLDRQLGFLLAVLTGVFVPVLLAVYGSRSSPLFSDEPGASTIARRSENAETTDVELVSLRVREDAIIEIFDEGGAKFDEAPTSRIDITIRNAGPVDSVVHDLQVEVLEYGRLVSCIPSGSPLLVSAGYDLELPTHDPLGKKVLVDVSQLVPARSADRFELVLSVQEPVPGLEVHLFQLDLNAAYNTAPNVLPIGQVVVAVPADDWDWTLGPTTGEKEHDACIESNRRTLAHFRDLPGVHAPRFNEPAESEAT